MSRVDLEGLERLYVDSERAPDGRNLLGDWYYQHMPAIIAELKAGRDAWDSLTADACLLCGAEPGTNIDCRLCDVVSRIEAATKGDG